MNSIIHLSRSKLSTIGGLERFISEMMSYQSSESKSIVNHFVIRSIKDYRKLIELLVKNNSYNKIYIHDPQIIYILIPALILRWVFLSRKNNYIILITHGLFFHVNIGLRGCIKKVISPILLFALKYVDAVYATSISDRDKVLKYASANIKIIGNGFCKPDYAEFNVRNTVLMVARESPNKNFKELFYLREKIQCQLSFALVCSNPSNYTRNKCNELKINLFDNADDEMLNTLYSKSIVIFSTSTYEGFGRTIIEGALRGAYPVYRRNPGHQYINDTIGIKCEGGFGLIYNNPEEVMEFFNKSDFGEIVELARIQNKESAEIFLWENILK